MTMTCVPVVVHLGVIIMGVSSLQNIMLFFVTFASNPPSHNFPKEIKETLSMLLQTFEFMCSAFSIERLGSCAVLIALIDSPLIKCISWTSFNGCISTCDLLDFVKGN